MLLKGKYAEAVVCTDFEESVESEAISQIINILNQPMMEGVKVRIMPDVHAGAGICIGYTATMNNYVVPNFIGVDIGCGLTALPLPYPFAANLQYDVLDKIVRANIPFGQAVNSDVNLDELETVFYSLPQRQRFYSEFDEIQKHIEDDCNKLGIDSGRVLKGIGSLGGGNHFISINRGSGKDGYNEFHLVVHSGSRNYGKCIAEFHQKRAGEKKEKSTGFDYLEGINREFYLADMKFAQFYAALNRRVILYRLARLLSVPYEKDYLRESVHNFIDIDGDNIIRKGAISAKKGEPVMIPLSMADGVLFGYGKGNPDWNCSAPHGAGRLMSRSKAKQAISLADYQRRMDEAGVWTSCVGIETLDESPQAYKDPAIIVTSIVESVEVVDRWREVYNFKAS